MKSHGKSEGDEILEEKEKKKQWGTAQLVAAAVILLAAAVSMTMAILWHINEFTLHLRMNGPEEITIAYGDPYDDPGAGAAFHGTLFMQEPLDIEVLVEGQVDPDTVGTYQIKYTAKHTVKSLFGDVVLTDYARRTVHIVDNVAPVISLVADPDLYTLPNETYQEEGFTATDNYDGDITHLVVRTESRESVSYQVSDSSGNVTQVERTIVYLDPTPPILVLKGDAAITVELGSPYQEPGYIATDNCDGTIIDRVTVSGTVDTDTLGEYTLTYTVSDNFGNTDTQTRTITVCEPAPEPEEPKPTKPTDPEDAQPVPVDPPNPVGGVIYLTFDDGPGPYTEKLLDILARYNSKASFFVVGTKYADTIGRIAEEGHTVAMHTATHNFKKLYASEAAFFEDLETIQALITQHTGQKSMLMRFPGGSSNTVSRFNEGIMTRLTQLVEEKGYTYFDWNVDSNDAGGATHPVEVFNNVVTGAAKNPNSVVLLHDIKRYTVEAVEDIIIWGLEHGYVFRALTESSPTCHHTVAN